MTVTEGSGNVFADLGLPDPEERQVKAQVAIYIEQLIENNGWTQEEAAMRMGLSQSDVSNIIRGRLKSFTLDRLFRCLNAIDQDVEIRIHPTQSFHAQVMVACG
jgi:predicted XRE-type DNA-binding protein